MENFLPAKLLTRYYWELILQELTTQTDAFKITSNGTVVTTYDKINILDPEFVHSAVTIYLMLPLQLTH